jgi:hypothetical protein
MSVSPEVLFLFFPNTSIPAIYSPDLCLPEPSPPMASAPVMLYPPVGALKRPALCLNAISPQHLPQLSWQLVIVLLPSIFVVLHPRSTPVSALLLLACIPCC